MRILVVNGPNLDRLGRREPERYGREPLEKILARVRTRAGELGVEIEAFQSNEEGTLVSRINSAGDSFDGIVLNPAAYTHTSVALRDAIQAAGIPCVEVHLTNLYAREAFRQTNYTAGACVGVVAGFGAEGYVLALEALAAHVGRSRAATGKKKRGRG